MKDRFNDELILCECGCKELFRKFDKWGNPRRFISGHCRRGKKMPTEYLQKLSQRMKGNQLHSGVKHSEETRQKMSNSLKGKPREKIRDEKHCRWKGDNITSQALHMYVRSRLPKPNVCELCKLVPPIDLANITGIYNRELKNWAYLCRKCHHKYDNIAVRGHITKKRNRNKNKLLSEFF